MKNKITFIIPFFCIDKELFKRCINSILIDNVFNIEVLVVNDGSPDTYIDDIAPLIEDERARIMTIPHSGVSAARNAGIRNATGDWVCFVDGDDYINSCTLQKIVEKVDGYDADVVIFTGGADIGGEIKPNQDYLIENHDYGEKREDKISIMESALSVGVLPNGYKLYFSYGSPCCKIIKKSFLIDNELFFDENVAFAEDVLFMLNVYLKADHIQFRKWYFYNYVNNPYSVTRKYRPGISDDMNVFFSRLQEFLKANHLENELERALYIRAQFELRRSAYLEFLHPDNKSLGAKMKYRLFINKEPYKTARKRNYLPKGRGNQRIADFALDNGFCNTYKLICLVHTIKRKVIHYKNNQSRNNNIP